MKLYYHPVSTASRPVVLFCEEHDLDPELVVIDLMTGEHYKEPYISINPNSLVPAIDDDGWILTESSAILKYLADKISSPTYPTDIRQRAKVNEMMDWFNTNFYREYGYHLIYPQLFAHHVREPAEANVVTTQWGKDKAARWLSVLNAHYLNDGRQYLCGNDLTIADYLGSAIATLGDTIGANLGGFSNVQRWLDNMRRRPSWDKVNEIFAGYCTSLKDKSFVTIE